MCLLIVQTPGKIVPESHLKESYKRNKDGLGFSFVHDNRIVTKHFKSLAKMIRTYKKDFAGNKGSNFMLHLRFGTSGIKDERNMHPFYVTKNVVLGHNGVFHNVSKDDKLCDTRMFINEYLKPIAGMDGFETNTGIIKMIGALAPNSKVAMLNSANKVSIANENRGAWNKGIWYSNTSYKKPKPIVCYNDDNDDYSSSFYGSLAQMHDYLPMYKNIKDMNLGQYGITKNVPKWIKPLPDFATVKALYHKKEHFIKCEGCRVQAKTRLLFDWMKFIDLGLGNSNVNWQIKMFELYEDRPLILCRSCTNKFINQIKYKNVYGFERMINDLQKPISEQLTI